MENQILSSSAGKKLKISRVYKRKKNREEHENVDMISHLPEPLLHYIFSFLDIKQAIQTSVLSRTWRYFWVSLPTLNFNYKRGTGYLETRNKNYFMNFVDRVLIFRDSSNIHKLAVVVKGHCDITGRLDTWILTSVMRRIQELSVQISTAQSCWWLPRCLHNCESLTKLVLGPFGKCSMVYLPGGPGTGSITLPRLKTLSLEAVEIGDDYSTDRFISEKCLPILETLILIDFHFPCGGLKISSLKLKHLRLESSGMVCDLFPDTTHFVKIHLNSPNLISFYYHGCMFRYCVLENLSSLVKADICVNEKPMFTAKEMQNYGQQSVSILRELHNMEELTFSLQFLKIASGALELLGNLSMQFRKLKCLKLEGTELSVDCICVISFVLNISPNIESLYIRMWRSSTCNCQYCNETHSNSTNEEDCWGAGLSLKCLRIFQFQNVRGCVNELKFLEMLLNKAMVLETLFVVFGFGESSYDEKRRRVKFSEKVVTGASYWLDSQPTGFRKLRYLKVTGTWRLIDNICAISYLLNISPNTETLYIEEWRGLGNVAASLLDMQPAQFCNLRNLKMVEMLLSIDSIYVIAYFLKLSPKIETFFFKISFSSYVIPRYWNPDEINSNSANKGGFWEALLSLEGLLNHLKYFELGGVTGLVDELELIEILLKNAILLEKLLIVFRKTYAKKEELEQTSEERRRLLEKFKKKVFTFQRTSSSVDIEFKYST